MPFLSNRRQDYQHCRGHLGCAMCDFLPISVPHATRAPIDATLGKRLSDGFAEGDGVDVRLNDGTRFALAGRDYGMEAWHEPDEDYPVQDDLRAHIVRSDWGHVSNAVERLTESPADRPGEDALPSLDIPMGLLDRLSASPFPAPKESDG